jgi:hypothetical protein
VRDLIVEAISEGNFATVAARLGGIGETTFWTWMDRGAKAPEPDDVAYDPDGPEEQYRVFREAVLYAQARAEREVVMAIKLQITGGWTKSVTRDPTSGEETRTFAGPNGYIGLEYLARVHRDRWSKPATTKVEVSGAETRPAVIETDDLERVAAKVRSRLVELAAGASHRGTVPPPAADPRILEGELDEEAPTPDLPTSERTGDSNG